MPVPDARLETLFWLFEAAEEIYPHVTVPRLRRLARAEPSWAALAGSMAQLVRDALAKGALFSDNRLRLTRSGSVQAVRVYRLHRRHELVATALGRLQFRARPDRREKPHSEPRP